MSLPGTNLSDLSPELINQLKKVIDGQELRLTITSAYALSEEEIFEIKKSLKLHDNREVLVENLVDESILGGLILKTENYFYDFSIKGKLQEITDKFNF